MSRARDHMKISSAASGDTFAKELRAQRAQTQSREKTNSKVLTELLVFLQGFLLSNLETRSGLRAELVVVEVSCTRHCCCVCRGDG